MGRDGASKLLAGKPDGTYLLRLGSNESDREAVLSYVSSGRVANWRVFCLDKQGLSLKEDGSGRLYPNMEACALSHIGSHATPIHKL